MTQKTEFKKKWQPSEGHLNLSRNLFNAELDDLLKEVAEDAYLEGYSIVPGYDRSNFEDYWNNSIP